MYIIFSLCKMFKFYLCNVYLNEIAVRHATRFIRLHCVMNKVNIRLILLNCLHNITCPPTPYFKVLYKSMTVIMQSLKMGHCLKCGVSKITLCLM